MSRIGKMPIVIPAGVDVKIEGNLVTVKGPKGELSRNIHPNITVEKDGNEIKVSRPNDEKVNRSLHGLSRTLIANMVHGVNETFKKELEVNGVGYRAELKGKDLLLKVGYSHDVIMTAPEGITIEVPAPNKIVISGADKQKVGQFAANVREKRPPEPYKGKGIKYASEHIRRKEGKAGKGGK
ncbi:MAG: 50S ribosomal protein L6 [Clostridia bacterium]|nr:50S ribosomal protein L6 [Clostridia bacterium]